MDATKMIDVSFIEAVVKCEKRLGTSHCECVKPVLHEWKDREHICRCGATWTSQRISDVVLDVEFEPDWEHPHGEVELDSYYKVGNT